MKVSILLGLLALLAPLARATDSYEYKPGEYLTIHRGLSPDKQYAIAGGPGKYLLYLMDAPAKKKIGPLTEIEETLDSGPESLHAIWAPDSRHVAITYREDRHLWVMKLYRIENKRAFLVEVPSLFDTVAPHFDREKYNMTDTSRGSIDVVWKSPTRFVLWEQSNYWHVKSNPKAKLGKFAKAVEEEQGLYFSAETICELIDKDRCKPGELKPGKFSDE